MGTKLKLDDPLSEFFQKPDSDPKNISGGKGAYADNDTTSIIIDAANKGKESEVRSLLLRIEEGNLDKERVKDFCFNYLHQPEAFDINDEDRKRCILLFLQHGIIRFDDTDSNNTERSIAYSAVNSGADEIVEFCLEQGFEVTEEVLIAAIKSDSSKTVQLCLDRGAEVTAESYYQATQNHYTATLLQTLLDHKPDIDAATAKRIFFPVICLAQNTAILELLLSKKGCDVNEILDGKTPLYYAAHSIDREGTINFLIQKGADIAQALECNEKLPVSKRMPSFQDRITSYLTRQTSYYLLATLPEGDLKDSITQQFQSEPLNQQKISELKKLHGSLLENGFSPKEANIAVAFVADPENIKILLKDYASLRALDHAVPDALSKEIMSFHIHYLGGLSDFNKINLIKNFGAQLTTAKKDVPQEISDTNASPTEEAKESLAVKTISEEPQKKSLPKKLRSEVKKAAKENQKPLSAEERLEILSKTNLASVQKMKNEATKFYESKKDKILAHDSNGISSDEILTRRKPFHYAGGKLPKTSQHGDTDPETIITSSKANQLKNSQITGPKR